MTDPIRNWLLAVLTGRPPPPPAPDADAVVAAARDHGVLCLLERQLAVHPQTASLPESLRSIIAGQARADAFEALALLAEQRRVFALLNASGVEYLVLKGGALAHWLYERPHLRLLTDLDLLLPDRASVDALESLLAELGYLPVVLNPVANERTFRRAGGPHGHFIVDAHWHLFNRRLLRGSFSYAELQAESMPLPDCAGARGLSPAHALFNAVGHRALSLPHRYLRGIQRADSLRWLWDIHALLRRCDAAAWQRLQSLAGEKRWSVLLLDAAVQAQTHLGTPVPQDWLATMAAQAGTEPMRMHWFSSSPHYQWREFLASDSAWRGRLSWLRKRLWPDPDWLQHYYGGHGLPRTAWPQRLLAGIRRFFG
jgi:hypothetical protein